MEGEEPILSTSSEGSPRLVKKKNGWTTLLCLAAGASTLGSCVPAGYNIGVLNAPAHVIKEFCNDSVSSRYGLELTPFNLDILWSFIVSIFIVGGIIGSLCGSWLADKCGRKGSIIVTDCFGILAAVCFVSCRQVSSVELLVLGRFIVGLASGLSTAVVPMYLTELAPLSLRGATGVMCPLGLASGVLFAQFLGLEDLLGREDTWHYLLAFYSLLILVTATAIPVLPESPKYLSAVKHENERAVKELVRVRGKPEDQIKDDIEVLQKESKKDGTEWTSCKVIRSRQLRLPLLLVCALQAGQQFSGINAVFYYSQTIFESVGLSKQEAQFGNLGAGVLNLAAAALSVYTMGRFGRRPLILISCIGAAACLCLLTVSISLLDAVSWMPYVSVASLLLYVLIYGFGLGPIPYFIGSELFEVGPRPVGMAFGSMSNWAGNLCVGVTFPSLQTLIQQYAFFIFFAIVVLLTIFIFLYFPETKDRDQSEIAELLQYGFKSDIKRKVSPIGRDDDTTSTETDRLSRPEGKQKTED